MVKIIFPVLVLAIISFCAPLHASEIPPGMDRDIRTLIELTGAENLTRALLSAEPNRFGSLMPENKAKEISLYRVNPEAAAIMAEAMLAPGGLVERLIPIYGKYYDHQEIQELIAHYSPHEEFYEVLGFYQSPLGQKVLRVNPLLQEDSLRVAIEWIESHGPALKSQISLPLLSRGLLPSPKPPSTRCPQGKPDPTYYTGKQVDVPPWVMSEVAFEYPKQAEENGISGSAILEINVDENGQVQELRIINSTPPGVFDQSVIDAFRKADFQPACKNGFTVRYVMRIEVHFQHDPGLAGSSP